jgi:hypothetical protein
MPVQADTSRLSTGLGMMGDDDGTDETEDPWT